MDGRAQLEGFLAEADPISNLNEQLPLSPEVSLEEFVDECNELIDGIDPRRHPFPEERSILLPNTKLLITPFQLWEGWRMLNQRERTGGLRGGLQASAAGIGKTFIVLTAALLRASIFENSRQVKAFWDQSPGTSRTSARPANHSHLPSSAHGNGLRCPSQRKGGTVCYCVPTSKARSFVDSGIAPRGVTLIQAPLTVVSQWVTVFESAVLDPSAYNLVIVHPDLPMRLKRDFTRITKSLSTPGARGSYQAPETFIFCSSHTQPRVFDTFTSAELPLSVGLLFSDESHRAPTLQFRSLAIAEAQSTTGDGVDLWLVSATPIKSLQDFELPVRLISSSSDLARTASVSNMISAHRNARSSDENMATFWSHWNKVFDSNLVLRNKVTSQFRGRAITSLQSIKPDIIWLNTPQQHIEDVQEIAYLARGVIREEARVAKNNGEVYKPDYASRVDGRLHFVSLFPGAANLIRRGELDVGVESVRRKIGAITVSNKLKVEKIPSFQQQLDEVSRGSPKLNYILEEIGRMRADEHEREPDPRIQATLRRENLSLKKMVILTPSLATAVFLYLFLLKRMPDLNPVCLHTHARPADCEAAFNSFKSLTARKNAKHSYVLITPFSIGGTGLNLQSANYQILVYPPSGRDTETQAFARTNRTGQRLPLHHSVLITQDNPADRINLVNYAGRSIRSDPFEMSRRLVLHELDGFKKIQRLEEWGYEVDDYDDDDLGEYLIKQAFPQIDASQFQACRVSMPACNSPRLDEIIHFSSDTIAGNTLGVLQAWNDFDERPRHERLVLRDLLLGIWVFRLNREVRDLRCIMYFTVVETALRQELRPRIYRLMNQVGLNAPLVVVHRESVRPEEREAFTTMVQGSPFCAGAQRMLEEYSEFAGIQIESFEFIRDEAQGFGNPDPMFNFKINFQ